jgi:aspartate carbamoyltransferase catalytic subunit
LKEFTREELELIFNAADELDPRKHYNMLTGKIMASLFFESSTRTRLSFESAMSRLDGRVIGWADASVSRYGDPARGETFEDTIRMIDDYSDVIVMRAPQTGLDYYPYVAADIATVPVINAGFRQPAEDMEHPTQGLIDLYTIRREKERIDGLKIALGGMIRYDRTLHAWLYGLANYDVELLLAHPEGAGPPDKYLDYVRKNRARYRVTSLQEALKEADVFFASAAMDYKGRKMEQLREDQRAEAMMSIEEWRITSEKIKEARKDLIIMNDLPRSGVHGFTILPEVDKTSHAAYFREAANGVRVRMAILSLVV